MMRLAKSINARARTLGLVCNRPACADAPWLRLLPCSVWPDDLIAAASEAAHAINPLNKADSRVLTDYPQQQQQDGMGGGVIQQQPKFDCVNNFPFDSAPLNELSLHPRILTAVAQVLELPISQVRIHVNVIVIA